ncbi:MAG: hypothetical protein QF752_04990 [Planctomycetota bacterium]|jgi:hypothetical protein|nr:hypothetical protein [Planctomycetota bacterium]
MNSHFAARLCLLVGGLLSGATPVAVTQNGDLVPDYRSQDLVISWNNAHSFTRTDEGILLVYQKNGWVMARRWSSEGQHIERLLSSGQARAVALASSLEKDFLLALWVERKGLLSAFSKDQGRTWSSPREMVRGPIQAPVGRVWMEGDTPQALVLYHTGNRESGQVWSVRMDGTNWSVPVRVDLGSGSFVTLAGEGSTSLAVWKDFRRGGRSAVLYQREYRNGGWGAERATGIEGADPSLGCSSEGHYWMGFQRFRRIWSTRSEDGGRTWKRPRRIPGVEGLFAHVACDSENRVAMAFERFLSAGDFRDDSVKGIGLVTSVDGGHRLDLADLAEKKASQIRSLVELSADGRMDLVWVDRSGPSSRIRWSALRLDLPPGRAPGVDSSR